ncbi:MAG: hypothetical protein MN733_43735 [Nitrososphaera sp.]|nr:hypothetical protein [Nitrososphaera sp.]
MKQLRSLLERQVGTEYVGAFPEYIYMYICDCLRAAENNIYIMCDRVTYGAFSAPDDYNTYMRILKEKHDVGVEVQMIVLNRERNRQLTNAQFIEVDNDDKFLKILNSDNKFETRVVSLSTRSRVAITNLGQFFEALSIFQQREIDRVKTLFSFREVDQIVPIHIWIADSRRAVFSIPSYTATAPEQGFATSDSNLISCLLSIWRRYSTDISSTNDLES